jgi:copper oxidase (laccase) domain-containing protein
VLKSELFSVINILNWYLAFIAGQVEGKYQADLYAIARFILNRLGVETSFRW